MSHETEEELTEEEIEMPQEQQRLRLLRNEAKTKIVWRDFSFLVLGAFAASIMGYVELNSTGSNSTDGDTAGGSSAHSPTSGIIDTGFIVTTPIYDFLRQNRHWNDVFAFINTIIGVFGPLMYMIYTTFWLGDYDVIFRYGAISLLRSFCGYFTYLPPDPTYLMSFYDFPDVCQCLIKECGNPEELEINPFVSFFSGHVATLVVTANHMYLHNYKTLGLFCHAFNVFQIVRLLATRGHYSIDIIIGFFMAAYVSNPAGRFGRHYSRGKYGSLSELIMPTSATEAFETAVGVADVRAEARMSRLLRKSIVRKALLDTPDDMCEDLPETTVRMAAKGQLRPVLEDAMSFSSSTSSSGTSQDFMKKIN